MAHATVVLYFHSTKKHSVRFDTRPAPGDTPAISNAYLANADYAALGRPPAIRVSIEAHTVAESLAQIVTRRVK